MATVPASIRNCNPGALYPGASSRKFGAFKTNIIGGGHQIAQFPDHVSGAAAMFDLLRRSYVGLTLEGILAKWSGGNSVGAYVVNVSLATGLAPKARVTRAFLDDADEAIALAKAMAAHEAGKEYPMSDEEWDEAYALATGVLKPSGRETATPWLDIAISKVGLAEVPGKKHNTEIVRMFALCGHPEVTDDETAWCAVFAGSCLIEAKYPAPDRKDSTMARSFLRYGVPVKEKDVRPGDLRIEARGPAPYGHVEFVVEVNGDRVKTIAGNVSNRVKYDDKPLKGALGYRRPLLGDKPVTTTIKESPSLKMLLNGLVAGACAAVMSAYSWLVETGGWALSLLPGAADHVSTTVSASRTIADQAGLSLPAKLLLAMTVACLVLTFVRGLSERRAAP
jgi:uncharacterized protein (TIGR02594 family)